MRKWSEFLREEEANGVVEVILILVVLIGAVVIFRRQLQALVSDLMSSVENIPKRRKQGGGVEYEQLIVPVFASCDIISLC